MTYKPFYVTMHYSTKPRPYTPSLERICYFEVPFLLVSKVNIYKKTSEPPISMELYTKSGYWSQFDLPTKMG